MSDDSSLIVQSDLPRSVAFCIERNESGDCVIRWRYPFPQHFGRTLALLVVIAIGLILFVVAAVSGMPPVVSVMAVAFFSIPLLILFVALISIAFDDREEKLTFHADHLKHETISTLVHYSFQIMDQSRYQFSNTGIYGSISRVGVLPHGVWFGSNANWRVDVPVLHRSEVTELSFHAFGESPECILLSETQAMLVGAYLNHEEQHVIASTIQTWMRGGSASEIGQTTREGIDKLNITELGKRSRDDSRWRELLSNPPNRCVVKRDGNDAIATAKYRNTTIHFREHEMTIETPHLGFVSRIEIANDLIIRVRQQWSSHILIDYLSDDQSRLRTLRLKANLWMGELIAARIGRTVYRSKLLPDPAT